MLTAANKSASFAPAPVGWRFTGWAGPKIIGAVGNRRTDAAGLVQALGTAVVAEAEQVHGAGIACLGRAPAGASQVPGCDALITDQPGIALVIRSADCLPILFAASAQRVVGIAHAGWRGLDARLPSRMLAAFWTVFRVPAQSLTVAIGPSIRACCYEVGPEFSPRLRPFIREQPGRRTCDLIAAARSQLEQGGVPARRVIEAGSCTACDTDEWFSLRREGAATGRLASVVLLRP